jgi:hypothetical protein
MYHYAPEDSIYAVLFKEMVSIKHLNLIKIIIGKYQKITITCFGVKLKGPFFGAEMFILAKH